MRPKPIRFKAWDEDGIPLMEVKDRNLKKLKQSVMSVFRKLE